MSMELTLVLKACLLRAVSTLLTMVPCRGEGPHILLEQTSTTFEPNWKLSLRKKIVSGLTSLRTLTTSSWYKPLSVIPFTWNKKSMIPQVSPSNRQKYWPQVIVPGPIYGRPTERDQRHHHHIVNENCFIFVDDHFEQLIDVITITSSSPASSSPASSSL